MKAQAYATPKQKEPEVERYSAELPGNPEVPLRYTSGSFDTNRHDRNRRNTEEKTLVVVLAVSLLGTHVRAVVRR